MALVEKIPKLKEIHDSNPRHIVFVGNEVECDIKGGNGVRFVLFASLVGLILQVADDPCPHD